MKKAKLFKWLSIICFLIAIMCLCYIPFETYLVNRYSPKITKSVLLKDKKHQHTQYNMDQVKPANMQRVIDARTHSNQVSVVGQMLVPSIGLHLPINRGVSNNSLLLGAGTMKPHQQMGKSNYALAGHHMISKSVLFSPLWFHAHLGTKVYITNMNNMYVYKIDIRKIISPCDVQVINNTKAPKITLITCNNSGSKRLLLQGYLYKKTPLKKMPKPIIKDATSRTNNHDVLKGY